MWLWFLATLHLMLRFRVFNINNNELEDNVKIKKENFDSDSDVEIMN